MAESWTKTAAIGSNQTHRQCGSRIRLAPIGALGFVADQDDRTPDLVELRLPPRPIALNGDLEVLITLKQLGPIHFEPGVGEDLSLGSMVILEQRRVAIMETEEPFGHLGPSGESSGLVGEEERFLAHRDRSLLPGHLVEQSRADPDQHAGDRGRGGESRAEDPGC